MLVKFVATLMLVPLCVLSLSLIGYLIVEGKKKWESYIIFYMCIAILVFLIFSSNGNVEPSYIIEVNPSSNALFNWFKSSP